MAGGGGEVDSLLLGSDRAVEETVIRTQRPALGKCHLRTKSGIQEALRYTAQLFEEVLT